MSRKEQILETAANLLQTRSYSSFSYKDLSDELGITKASIHHHYESKEELGKALIEMYFEKISSHLKAIEDRGLSAWKRFDAYLDMSKGIAHSGNKICPIGVIRAEANVVPKTVKEGMDRVCSYIHGWLTDLLKEGRKTGEIKFEGKPEDQAYFIAAVVQGGLQAARCCEAKQFDLITKQLKKSMKP